MIDVFEVKQKETLNRRDVAARLRELAEVLAGDDEEIEFERGGMNFKVHVPDEIELKVEFEIDSDERELELELKW